MNYLKQVKGLLFLENKTYKQIVKNKKSFKRYLYNLFISCYIALILLFILNKNLLERVLLITNNYLILIISLIFVPLFILAIDFTYYYIPYFIGKLLNGKPKNYLEYFTISNYASPFFYFFIILSNGYLNSIAMIFEFFILYKTYIISQKLNSKKAKIGIIINIFLILIFYLVLLILF